jgi:hypothetical protein
MSADPKVTEFDARLAATLASEPTLVLAQMKQHREIVAGLRTDVRNLNRRIVDLTGRLARYECPCGIEADPLDEHHACRPAALYEAEREDAECR